MTVEGISIIAAIILQVSAWAFFEGRLYQRVKDLEQRLIDIAQDVKELPCQVECKFVKEKQS